MTVALSEILSSRRLSGDTVTFTATEDWMQGRTMFGGFLSALAVVAMRDTLGIDMPLRALQTNFVGPVPAGDVVYRTRLLRQGKSVSQVQCEIYSDETLAGLVVGVFGAPPVGDVPALPFIPKITPNFLQHVEMRWALGSIPYMGNPFWESGIYIRATDKNLSPEVLIGWFQIDMETKAGSDGYVNQSAKLWTPDGQLASLGYQV
eukprot:gene18471-18338_t